jgi:metal transporter CNNM
MSGLTMGLLSLDIMSLEVLKRGGKPHQQRYSTRILQLVKRHHLLLVTLLLANAVAVEAMPIFLSKITSEVVAVIVSVTAILIFGE